MVEKRQVPINFKQTLFHVDLFLWLKISVNCDFKQQLEDSDAFNSQKEIARVTLLSTLWSYNL